MIGIAVDGAVRLAGVADAAAQRAGAAGSHTRGTLERALPGEWLALFLTVVAIAVVGGAILVAARVSHGRMVARRRNRRPAQLLLAQRLATQRASARRMSGQRATAQRMSTQGLSAQRESTRSMA